MTCKRFRCHIKPLGATTDFRDKHDLLGSYFHCDIFYIHKWINSTCFQESIKNYLVICFQKVLKTKFTMYLIFGIEDTGD